MVVSVEGVGVAVASAEAIVSAMAGNAATARLPPVRAAATDSPAIIFVLRFVMSVPVLLWVRTGSARLQPRSRDYRCALDGMGKRRETGKRSPRPPSAGDHRS